MDNRQYLFATLPRRLKASIVDGILLLTLFVVNPLIVGTVSDHYTGWGPLVMFVPLLVLEPFLITFFGFTPGQYIFGIEVVRIAGPSKCPLLISFARTYTKYLLGSFSLFYILFSKKYQAIHDHLADTIVVLSKRRLESSPQFARYGAVEQVSEERFTYPSPIKRFVFFLVWYVSVGSVFELLIQRVTPSSLTADPFAGRLSQPFWIIHDLLFSLLFFGVALFAAKGYLPGAKRKKKVLDDKTVHP